MDYNSIDFLNTLDETRRDVFHIVHGYIADKYPEYKPFDIRPTNKSGAQWLLAYRKRPKTGKAICEWITDEKKSIREIRLGGQTSAVYFVRFRLENYVETMQALVPLDEG